MKLIMIDGSVDDSDKIVVISGDEWWVMSDVMMLKQILLAYIKKLIDVSNCFTKSCLDLVDDSWCTQSCPV